MDVRDHDQQLAERLAAQITKASETLNRIQAQLRDLVTRAPPGEGFPVMCELLRVQADLARDVQRDALEELRRLQDSAREKRLEEIAASTAQAATSTARATWFAGAAAGASTLVAIAALVLALSK